MTKEVDLVSYLPPFMAEYKEISAALEAENPEFVLVWNAIDRILQNEFIETADEYGISRFEKLLGVLPSKEDTLESRRARIQTRWFNALPYTVKSLIAKLTSLCAGKNFSITKEFDSYQITVETEFELFGQVEEVEKALDAMIPSNMIVNIFNRISYAANGHIFMGGAIAQNINFTINTEVDDKKVLNGYIAYAGYVVDHKNVNVGMETTKEQILQGRIDYSNVISTYKKVTVK